MAPLVSTTIEIFRLEWTTEVTSNSYSEERQLQTPKSNLMERVPNAQLSSFGCQMVKIAFYNRMKTTADSVLFYGICS